MEPIIRRVLYEWFAVQMPADLEPPETRPDVPIEPYLGIYDRGDMFFELAMKDENVKITIVDRQERLSETAQTYDLVPCPEPGVFLLMIPGVPRGMAVVFQRWGDGRLYMHAGGRSTPKAESASPDKDSALAAMVD
ncbi:MAG: hypothetical protein ACRDFX_12410 [Chloroflexota bacterium]